MPDQTYDEWLTDFSAPHQTMKDLTDGQRSMIERARRIVLDNSQVHDADV
jgi:hypothetical protein